MGNFFRSRFENIWEALAFCAVTTALVFIAIVFFAPKNVDYYYVGAVGQPNGCVYAHWTWHADEKVYCSDDSAKNLDFTVKANAALKH